MVQTQTLVLTGALLGAAAVAVVLIVRGRKQAYLSEDTLRGANTIADWQQATTDRFREYQPHPDELHGITFEQPAQLEYQDEKAPLDFIGMHVLAKAFGLQAGQALYWTDASTKYVASC
jgi:hypothetical protein